ncbi:AraC family transcriptional regulator [Flavitalea antarctica]
MLLHDFVPSPGLRMYVKCFRVIHFYFDPLQPIPFKAYPPKPEQVLHFFLREPFIVEKKDNSWFKPSSILFTTQQTSLVKQYTDYNFIDLQIVFQPTAIFQLTGIPATALTNRFLDATLLFPPTIQSTFSRLQEVKHYDQMILILENCATDLFRKVKSAPPTFDEACRKMIRQHGNIMMDELAREACYSSKQFKRKFAEMVGVNPKTYARILMLNRAYNLRNCFPGMDWNIIAAKSGYTDYQHLAKAYKEFNGLTPSELHSLEQKSPENMLGLTKKLYHKRATDFS